MKHSDYYTYSFDKKKLYARFYHNNPSSKTIVIEFHGYKGNCVRDMTGGLPFDYEKGLNIFMVDLRGHGRSDGTTISFGVLERNDVKTWVDFVLKEFGEDISIYLYGASMGAATILMASEFDFPKQVKGIIADCPFSDPLRMVGIGAKLKGFKSKFILDSLRISSKVYGHFDIRESSALNSVKNTKLPILLLHGEKDSFVPSSMSDEIKKANDSIEYHTFKEADHALSFALYTEEYFDILMKFMERTSKN